MDTNNLLMTGFVLTLGAMAILISIISFGFMIMYQIKNDNTYSFYNWSYISCCIK